MKYLLFLTALMSLCKFLTWKTCSECGSLRTKIVICEKIDWGENYEFITMRGLFLLRHQVKICSCCGNEFVQQISARLPSSKQLKKYAEKTIREGFASLD